MTLQFDSLPNELYLLEIYPYLSLIDLHYGFSTLNQRFNELVRIFLSRKVHRIDITRDIKLHHAAFTIDHVLPYLPDNHRLTTVELCHADLFVKFQRNMDRINANYLNKFVIISYIDIHFDIMMKFLNECSQLNEVRFNVMTSLDSSWSNGRKWTRWFETMRREYRHHRLKVIDVCVWCVNMNEAISFDARTWNYDGTYRLYDNWKVQIKPDRNLNWSKSRHSVELSRSEKEYIMLLESQKNSSCVLS